MVITILDNALTPTTTICIPPPQQDHIVESEELLHKNSRDEEVVGGCCTQTLHTGKQKSLATPLAIVRPLSGDTSSDEYYFHGFERSENFEQLFQRLHVLEKWKELAVRPDSLDACDPEDLDLFEKELDDVPELQERCNQVRIRMNASLPPIEIIEEWDCCLVPKESCIEDAGLGLFYEPPLQQSKIQYQDIIPKGTAICYYSGHIHNFHSSRELLSDKSYLMMIQGEIFVDAGPSCTIIKARYMNDPLNESAVNCQFIPEEWRAVVVTTRDILPGEELFASYGEYYWRQQDVPGKRYRA
jgi:hypothetical protein